MNNEVPDRSSTLPGEVVGDMDGAQTLQKAYEASRRAWAMAVGRPYDGDRDHRPPPGELDAEPDE